MLLGPEHNRDEKRHPDYHRCGAFCLVLPRIPQKNARVALITRRILSRVTPTKFHPDYHRYGADITPNKSGPSATLAACTCFFSSFTSLFIERNIFWWNINVGNTVSSFIVFSWSLKPFSRMLYFKGAAMPLDLSVVGELFFAQRQTCWGATFWSYPRINTFKLFRRLIFRHLLFSS